MSKEERLTPVRVTKDEKKKVEARAASLDMKVSAYIRTLLEADIPGFKGKVTGLKPKK